MSFGIITKKLSATNTKGARVQARMHTAQGQNRSVTVPYEHAWSLVKNERYAAEKLAASYDCKLVGDTEYDYIMACGNRVWEACAA